MIEIFRCGEHDIGKTNCANSTEINALFSNIRGFVQFNIFTINTKVQPGSKTPIVHYLDDTKSVLFGQSIGQVSVLEVAEYELKTDNSLMPWKSIETEEGAVVR